jgi:uncharacterized protein DUF4058
LEEALQPRLPEPYFADSSERIWIEMSYRYIEPDLSVMRGTAPGSSSETAGGVAVASPSISTPVVVTVEPVRNDEQREAFLEVYHGRHGGRRLVTVIEALSPSNKTPGEQGRDLYLRKQREVLAGQANLVEIDLLRGGEHTTAVPRQQAEEQAGPFDYHVSVYRFQDANRYYVHPIHLASPLPVIGIPLLPGDGEVPLDLQAVFNRCYDTGPYRREVRYDLDVSDPPLLAPQQAWATKMLAGKQTSVNQ